MATSRSNGVTGGQELDDLSSPLVPETEDSPMSGEGEATVTVKYDLENGQPGVEIDQETRKPLIYRVEEVPPPHLSLMFALQQALLVISAPLGMTLLISEIVCAQQDEGIKLELLSAHFLMAGLSTVMMTTFGVRLPIFQGPASSYIIPLLTLASLDEWKCPATFKELDPVTNATIVMADMGNGTSVPIREIALGKIAIMSGSLMTAGVFHSIIGMTGLVGVLCRYVGPITIVPTIVLVGLHIFKVAVKFSEPDIRVAMVVLFFNLLFSLFLRNKQTPIPRWSRSKGFYVTWYPLHQVFSLLASLLIGWILSAILTASGAYSDDADSKDYLARTDSRMDTLQQADWFMIPYPGKLGGFSFNAGVFINFLVASLLSVLDSIGDYTAAAKTARVSPPPAFAFNRGIAIEGVLSFLSGTCGCCAATVSFGGCIGAMGITRVVSRRVFQLTGFIFIACSLLGKFGGFFITIPYPVLGGTTIITIGIFVGVVLSNLQSVDLSSTRNMAIVGIALLLGLVMPYWVQRNSDSINTGNFEVDSILKMILANPSFVGGAFSCIMDNLVPGTLKERGLADQLKELDDEDAKEMAKDYDDGPEVYRLPFLSKAFRRSYLVKLMPIFYHEEEDEKDDAPALTKLS